MVGDRQTDPRLWLTAASLQRPLGSPRRRAFQAAAAASSRGLIMSPLLGLLARSPSLHGACAAADQAFPTISAAELARKGELAQDCLGGKNEISWGPASTPLPRAVQPLLSIVSPASHTHGRRILPARGCGMRPAKATCKRKGKERRAAAAAAAGTIMRAKAPTSAARPRPHPRGCSGCSLGVDSPPRLAPAT